ncbi:MAG: SIMPL domain-containing protein [Maricaulaceae bacterium]
MPKTLKPTRHIQVIGTSEYLEKAIEFRMGLSLEMSSSLSKSGHGRGGNVETEKYLNEIIALLVKQGFPEDQILFGGTNDQNYWQPKKAYGNLRANRLMLRHADQKMIMMVPFWLEGFKTGKHDIRYTQHHPLFEAEDGADAEAFAKALSNAKRIAGSIAAAGDAKLGPLQEAQDQSSHFNDDMFMQERSLGAPMGSDGQTLMDRDLETPTRKVSVSLRVVFGLA